MKPAAFGLSQAKQLTAAHEQAFTELLRQGLIIDVGKTGRDSAVALCEGCGPEERKIQLAKAALTSLSKGRLALIPASGAAFQKRTDLPTGIRKLLGNALRALIEAGDAFPVKVGRQSFFVLREDLETTLAGKPQKRPAPRATADRSALSPGLEQPGGRAGENGEAAAPADESGRSIRQAYQALREKTGRRNILIRSLCEHSGVDLSVLRAWLKTECRAHRANPTGTELTAASEADIDAALVLNGDRFLYVELYP